MLHCMVVMKAIKNYTLKYVCIGRGSKGISADLKGFHRISQVVQGFPSGLRGFQSNLSGPAGSLRCLSEV